MAVESAALDRKHDYVEMTVSYKEPSVASWPLSMEQMVLEAMSHSNDIFFSVYSDESSSKQGEETADSAQMLVNRLSVLPERYDNPLGAINSPISQVVALTQAHTLVMMPGNSVFERWIQALRAALPADEEVGISWASRTVSVGSFSSFLCSPSLASEGRCELKKGSDTAKRTENSEGDTMSTVDGTASKAPKASLKNDAPKQLEKLCTSYSRASKRSAKRRASVEQPAVSIGSDGVPTELEAMDPASAIESSSTSLELETATLPAEVSNTRKAKGLAGRRARSKGLSQETLDVPATPLSPRSPMRRSRKKEAASPKSNGEAVQHDGIGLCSHLVLIPILVAS